MKEALSKLSFADLKAMLDFLETDFGKGCTETEVVGLCQEFKLEIYNRLRVLESIILKERG